MHSIAMNCRRATRKTFSRSPSGTNQTLTEAKEQITRASCELMCLSLHNPLQTLHLKDPAEPQTGSTKAWGGHESGLRLTPNALTPNAMTAFFWSGAANNQGRDVDERTGREDVGGGGGNGRSSDSRRHGNGDLGADAQAKRMEEPHTPRTREQMLAKARKDFDKEREKWAHALSGGPGAEFSDSEHVVQ